MTNTIHFYNVHRSLSTASPCSTLSSSSFSIPTEDILLQQQQQPYIVQEEQDVEESDELPGDNSALFDAAYTIDSWISSSSDSLKAEGEIFSAISLKSFSFKELQDATQSFSPDVLLREGGFGSVFKGWIDEYTLTATKTGSGIAVAVKSLNQKGLQGHTDWLAEVQHLGQLYHPNLVRLFGYCLEDEQRLLVYEFMPGGSLENHLFGRHSQTLLSWTQRMKVALGAAQGLAFLHSAEKNAIHRDFTTSNILLDMNYNVKLSDFMFAKDGPIRDASNVSAKLQCTCGHASPEYISTAGQVFPEE